MRVAQQKFFLVHLPDLEGSVLASIHAAIVRKSPWIH